MGAINAVFLSGPEIAERMGEPRLASAAFCDAWLPAVSRKFTAVKQGSARFNPHRFVAPVRHLCGLCKKRMKGHETAEFTLMWFDCLALPS